MVIMVSEQKAQCFQKELQVVKKKGILTMMKLKEMMESKGLDFALQGTSFWPSSSGLFSTSADQLSVEVEQIIEAELTSLSQQRKIEELEAQLEEAEDIRLYSMNQKLRAHSCHTKVNMGNCYDASSDLPSISLRGEVLELYQNGHTHRIHDAEGNPSDRESFLLNILRTFFEDGNMPTNNFLTDDSTLARGNAPSEDPSEMGQGLSIGKGNKA
ncbi:hypothetical protein HAX54_050949 [Datura stramonium]|uniref:Uncharacterized protein n=1 Tax=Datura stramonium TaxID=4076 RepID=A0ABS8WPB2_DATST|nr:hypothetical protein [Datura stramonium]